MFEGINTCPCGSMSDGGLCYDCFDKTCEHFDFDFAIQVDGRIKRFHLTDMRTVLETALRAQISEWENEGGRCNAQPTGN